MVHLVFFIKKRKKLIAPFKRTKKRVMVEIKPLGDKLQHRALARGSDPLRHKGAVNSLLLIPAFNAPHFKG